MALLWILQVLGDHAVSWLVQVESFICKRPFANVMVGPLNKLAVQLPLWLPLTW